MTKEKRLEVLRDDWQRSNDRIFDLARLSGRDHTHAAVLLAREFQTRRILREQILQLTKEDQS
jgi:hypothetical protein